MKSLAELIRLKKQIRAIGIDDAPFQKERSSSVNLSGIICSDTRFEGMLWGEVQKDGDDATDRIIQLIQQSKFYSQINAVLLDGIAVGGFNIIDLALLSESLQRPCIAVMRKQPNILKIHQALDNFADAERRKQLIAKAGEIYFCQQFCFQVKGCTADEAGQALIQITDQGNVPESLRLAHLIGAAIKTGQSTGRA